LEEQCSKLWSATVILFRSQLKVLETNGKLSDVKVEELFDNEIYITADTGVLSIWLDWDSGEGSWNVITDKLQRAEPWFMSADGKVELSGESMELPTAVGTLIEKLLTK